jgi:hypothetical protein
MQNFLDIQEYCAQLLAYRKEVGNDVLLHVPGKERFTERALHLTEKTLDYITQNKDGKSVIRLDLERAEIFQNLQKMPADYTPEFMQRVSLLVEESKKTKDADCYNLLPEKH